MAWFAVRVAIGLVPVKFRSGAVNRALRDTRPEVRFDAREVNAFLDGLARDMPRVAASALNSTAFQLAREEWPDIARQEVDSPTKFARPGGRFAKATPTSLAARIYLAPIQERYLLPRITGGLGARQQDSAG